MVTEKREGQHGHQGVFLLQPQSPWAVCLHPAWLPASFCLQGLCDLGPALQWGQGTGQLGLCRQVASGLISRGWWELWVGMEAPQAGALVPGPGMILKGHCVEAFS